MIKYAKGDREQPMRHISMSGRTSGGVKGMFAIMSNRERNIIMSKFHSEIFIISMESLYFPIHHAISEVSPTKTTNQTPTGREQGTSERHSFVHLHPDNHRVQVPTTHRLKYPTPTSGASYHQK